MENSSQQSKSTVLLDTVVHDIESESIEVLQNKLDECHPAETANLLESMPPSDRQALWEMEVSDKHDSRSEAEVIADAKRLLADLEEDGLTVPA